MYSVEFSQTAEKQFLRLEKRIQDRVIAVIERTKIRPFHFIKRKESTHYYILRVGDYRQILDVDNKNLRIAVMELGHRRDIYDH